MSEKLEKALEELNDLMKQVSDVTSTENDDVTKNEMAYMDTKDDEMAMADDESDMDKADEEDMDKADEDMEEKQLDEDSTRDYDAGELVVDGGNPKSAPAELKSFGLDGADFATLDLSAENVEKAYAKYKAEKMEAMAYDSLSKQFEARLTEELSVKKAEAEKASYDARTDVAALKEEFAELRKSLSEKDTEIRKAQEVAFALPDGMPTSIEAAADMSWEDIHALTRGD